MTQEHTRHVVLTNPALRGLEYGMLRDFEDEIIRVTGAERVIAPSRSFPPFIGGRLAHGTRYSGVRKWVPKEEYELKADVLWVVLMGPENFTLDMFKGWDRHVGLKILYLFDTFDEQLASVRRVVSATKWDFISTAFPGNREFLEQETQQPWHLIRHGVNLNRFRPAPIERRVIDFSAYGRRFEPVHKAMRDYCNRDGKYYDFTITASVQPELDPREHYAQYAWHLSHSIFNFCWPMEMTTPGRAKAHSPITCRWFEAAASGNVILGKAPADPGFEEIFGKDAVIEINHEQEDPIAVVESLWEKREFYLKQALERRAKHSPKWSWVTRIDEIQTANGLSDCRKQTPESEASAASVPSRLSVSV